MGTPGASWNLTRHGRGVSVKRCGGQGTIGTGCGFEIGGFFSDLVFFHLGGKNIHMLSCFVFINFGGI